MSKTLTPGVTLANKSGETITVLETGVTWAGKTNGVRFRYADGQERTLPASSLRSYRTATDLDDRAARHDALAEQVEQVARLLADPLTRTQTFIGKMDGGEPCVQLNLTAATFGVLHRLVVDAFDHPNALDDIIARRS